MNWCKPHWEQLRQKLKDKGLDGFGAKTGEAAADHLAKEIKGDKAEFDPLLGCWARINAAMLESPGCRGRIMQCPLCILVDDGQPETVENWLDGCTQNALDYAFEQGLIQRH